MNESVTKCEGSKVAGERRRSRIGIGIGEEAVARKGRGLIELEYLLVTIRDALLPPLPYLSILSNFFNFYIIFF